MKTLFRILSALGAMLAPVETGDFAGAINALLNVAQL
jgi:hypothetical protein